jgi:hypothetical protein
MFRGAPGKPTKAKTRQWSPLADCGPISAADGRRPFNNRRQDNIQQLKKCFSNGVKHNAAKGEQRHDMTGKGGHSETRGRLRPPFIRARRARCPGLGICARRHPLTSAGLSVAANQFIAYFEA